MKAKECFFGNLKAKECFFGSLKANPVLSLVTRMPVKLGETK
jgi:hypothetical protein